MDKVYWDNYYKKNVAPSEPSHFAQTVLPQLATGGQLLELGCGNGRDSIFFASNGLNVVGLDQSPIAIDMLTAKYAGDKSRFIVGDFTQAAELAQQDFDYVYSRFTFHAINDEQQMMVLGDLSKLLKHGGLFFLEARSIKDPLYGQGEWVGRHAYIFNDHYRRFLDLAELVQQIEGCGMTIKTAIEDKNLAVCGQDNPYVIRVTAQWNG